MNSKTYSILTCSILLVCFGVFAKAEENPEQTQGIRQNFKQPVLLNFSKFKSLFHKHYTSIMEEVVRQKIFIGRAFRAFISMVKYRYRKLSHYLSVNSNSDETPEERAQRQISAQTLRESLDISLPHVDVNTEETFDLENSSLELNNSRKDKLSRKRRHVEPAKNDLDDGLELDLRKYRCFTPIRDQMRCGSCYAFATIAMYEYNFCLQTGKLIPFSEQYIVDCGVRNHMRGCKGGKMSHAIQFTEEYGLQLRSRYPYKASNGACPYEEDFDPKQMGRVRTIKTNTGQIYFDEFENFLRKRRRPIGIGFLSTPDFDDYGGGVDTASLGCSEKTGHGLLVVGFGEEDGLEYYLLRNSYSDSWGEEGYYKFAKSDLKHCTAYPHGLVSVSTFAKI